MSHSHSHGHGHDHGHGHHHDHNPEVRNHNRTFGIAIALNVAFVAIEAVYGLAADSLALLADAGHNLSDVLGLLMAWGAIFLARREPSRWRTYGMRKTTILAALFNALILLMAIGGIAWEAVRRLAEPAPVAGMTVVVVAAIGVVINAATMLLFVSDSKDDINIRGAFMHMAADAAVSLGVVVAGLIIFYTGLLWLDPVISLVIVAVIFIGTWSLLKESLNLAMDAVPKGIDPDGIRQYLTDLPGVEAVHDLHIWGLSTTETALTAHLVKPDAADDDRVIQQASETLRTRFGVGHITLQWERDDQACTSNVNCC